MGMTPCALFHDAESLAKARAHVREFGARRTVEQSLLPAFLMIDQWGC